MTVKDPSELLDDTAASIKHLVSTLEDREKNGEVITPTEIRTIASRLQNHVAALLSATKRIREAPK